MKEVARSINYKGKEYKIVFNLNVMEEIQAEYKTLDDWGALTDGKSGETDIKALIFGLKAMLNEGIEINNEETGSNDPLLTHKQVGRIISEVGLGAVAENMNGLVVDSTKVDDEPKNE